MATAGVDLAAAVEAADGQARELSRRYPLRLVGVWACWELDAAGAVAVRPCGAGVRFDDRRPRFDSGDGYRWVRVRAFRAGRRADG